MDNYASLPSEEKSVYSSFSGAEIRIILAQESGNRHQKLDCATDSLSTWNKSLILSMPLFSLLPSSIPYELYLKTNENSSEDIY